MEEFFHILLHSLKDTAILLPVLFVVYFLIEFLEYKNVFKFQNSKLLKGRASPAMGALFGSVPQCGFSVISSELYAEKKISIGALIAVYVATSDEAIPIMLTSYKSIPAMLMLVLTKLILAIGIGYLAIFISNKLAKSGLNKQHNKVAHDEQHDKHEHDEHDEHHDEHKHHDEDDEHHDEHEDEKHEHIHACCHHDTESNKFNWKHPLIHCVKIFAYIFVINVVMGTIIHFVGEDNLTNFLKSSSYFQPLFALLIGLIPNCASSVILTELYLMGGLSFGSIIAGLCVNAGIGIMILFKQNKNLKENLFIVAMLIIPSLMIGYALHFIPFEFLLI